jgi:predicted Holliday junction resolvase-like endonuclease
MRFSDIRLQYAGKGPETWLDKHETKILLLQKKEEKFLEKELEMRKKATEKGRAQVPSLVKQSFDKDLAKLSYDPYDVKALLHPVDFIIFDGLEQKKKVENVVFLSKKIKDKELNKVRKTIKDTIEDENYDWKIARVSIEGKIELE